jgi:hypothetical protein
MAYSVTDSSARFSICDFRKTSDRDLRSANGFMKLTVGFRRALLDLSSICFLRPFLTKFLAGGSVMALALFESIRPVIAIPDATEWPACCSARWRAEQRAVRRS